MFYAQLHPLVTLSSKGYRKNKQSEQLKRAISLYWDLSPGGHKNTWELLTPLLHSRGLSAGNIEECLCPEAEWDAKRGSINCYSTLFDDVWHPAHKPLKYQCDKKNTFEYSRASQLEELQFRTRPWRVWVSEATFPSETCVWWSYAPKLRLLILHLQPLVSRQEEN